MLKNKLIKIIVRVKTNENFDRVYAYYAFYLEL